MCYPLTHALWYACIHTPQHINTQVNKWRQSFELLIIILEVQKGNDLGQASVPTTCKVGCWGSVNIQTPLSMPLSFQSSWMNKMTCVSPNLWTKAWVVFGGRSFRQCWAFSAPHALFKPFLLKNELSLACKRAVLQCHCAFLPHSPTHRGKTITLREPAILQLPQGGYALWFSGPTFISHCFSTLWFLLLNAEAQPLLQLSTQDSFIWGKQAPASWISFYAHLWTFSSIPFWKSFPWLLFVIW